MAFGKNTAKKDGGATPSYVQSKEPGARVTKSDTGKNGGQARTPKGSTEGLKGGNKKVKQRVNSAGH